ncbi:DNA primase [Burkholderia phage vB_BglM_WTB]
MKQNVHKWTAACEEFLSELGRGLPEDERIMAGYAEEATVQTDATGKKINGGWWPVPYKNGKYIDPRKNCYVCISSSIKTENPKTKQMRYWRGEASFGHGLALMVDDIGTGKGSKGNLTVEFLSSILEPTAVVETSPGNHQLWYFLEEPEENMVRFKAFLSCFVEKVLQKGGDNTIKDVSRYGRMPLGINNKRHGPDAAFKYAGSDGKPFEVVLRSAEYGRRYTIDAIARAFSFDIVVPAKHRTRSEDIDVAELAADFRWLELAETICGRLGMGEGSDGQVTQNMSGKYRIRCPWGDEHTNGDPFGAYFRGPIPGAEVEFVFGCGHDTCRKIAKRTWTTFVDTMIMPAILEKLRNAEEDFDWYEDWIEKFDSHSQYLGAVRYIPWPRKKAR